MDNAQSQQDFNRADKPDKVRSPHIAVMNVIFALTLPSNISQVEIAKRAGCCQREVSTAMGDIDNWEWVRVKSGARNQKTNWIEEILYENLPTHIPRPKVIVGDFALRFAQMYKQNFVATWAKYQNNRGHNCTKPLPKDWLKRWSTVIQLRLNQGYTEQELVTRLSTVGREISWNKTLRMGPQNRKLFPAKKTQEAR